MSAGERYPSAAAALGRGDVLRDVDDLHVRGADVDGAKRSAIAVEHELVLARALHERGEQLARETAVARARWPRQAASTPMRIAALTPTPAPAPRDDDQHTRLNESAGPNQYPTISPAVHEAMNSTSSGMERRS